MSHISSILKAIKEYRELKDASPPGDNYSFPLVQAKKHIENEIIALIDSRIKTYMGRERRKSGVNSAVKEPELSEKDIVFDVLNSAPVPPSNVAKWITQNPEVWIENYTDWYYGKRLKALK